MGMRKSVLLVASLALALLLVSGVALAITKTCKINAERCKGTDNPDLIIGSEGWDTIYGLGANDILRGKAGNDHLLGGKGQDTIEGGADADTINKQTEGRDGINGGDGNDHLVDYSSPCERGCESDRNLLVGGGGDDYIVGHNRIQGGPGDDFIIGYYVSEASAFREITGGGGNDRIQSKEEVDDTIYVRDGERDHVSCGNGTDTVYFDEGIDVIKTNCERLNPPQ